MLTIERIRTIGPRLSRVVNPQEVDATALGQLRENADVELNLGYARWLAHESAIAVAVAAARAEALAEAVALIRPSYRAQRYTRVDHFGPDAINDALHRAADQIEQLASASAAQ